jgi:hypothetical protein
MDADAGEEAAIEDTTKGFDRHLRLTQSKKTSRWKSTSRHSPVGYVPLAPFSRCHLFQFMKSRRSKDRVVHILSLEIRPICSAG